MKIEQETTINGRVVTQVDSIKGLSFYEREYDDCTKLFLVDDEGNVIRTISIEADCSQNFGYVSNISFS